jgi:hypothetical protein
VEVVEAQGTGKKTSTRVVIVKMEKCLLSSAKLFVNVGSRGDHRGLVLLIFLQGDSRVRKLNI